MLLEVRRPHVDVGWQKSLGKLVALLEPSPFDADQFALHEQLLEGPLGGLPVPPAGAARAWIFKISCEQRSLGANPVQHPGAQAIIGVVVPPPPIAVRDAPHHGQNEAVVAHRQVARRMAPVLEGAMRLDETIQQRFVVPGDPVVEDMVVGAGNHGDGVDLDVPDLAKDLLDPGHPGAELALAGEPLMLERQAAQLAGAGRTGHGAPKVH